MSGRIALRVEEGALVLTRSKGAEGREVRIAVDGSTTEVAGPRTISRYRGAWKDEIGRAHV